MICVCYKVKQKILTRQKWKMHRKTELFAKDHPETSRNVLK